MIEIVDNIKAFARYYNTLIKEIERITPIKRTVVSVFKNDCGYNYYEDEEQDVVDESKQISEIPQFPPLQEILERKKQFEIDCDKMILSGDDVLFRSLLRLFKRLQYYPTDFQFVDKELYDAKIIVDMVSYLGVHIIGSYESIGAFFDSIEERRALLLKSSQNVKQKEKEQCSFTFPKELDTVEAKGLFQKIIDLGVCVHDGNLYKWKGTPSLFGYFVDVGSNYLNVRQSNGRIPWKLFQPVFQCSDTDISTAKQAVNGYKNKNLSEPEGFLDIKKICR